MIFGGGGALGIGYFIQDRRTNTDIAGVFAAIIVIVIIGMVVEYGIFRNIENKTFRKWGNDTMSNEVLKISNLVKKYDNSDRVILNNLDLTINDEDFLCILGPSGCGKIYINKMYCLVLKTMKEA